MVVVVAVVAVVGVAALLLTQLGGDDEPSDEERAYADALVAQLQADGPPEMFSQDDLRCIAEAGVEAIGLESLRRAGTPEEVQQDPDRLEFDLNEGQAAAYYDGMTSCVDIREVFAASLREEGVSQAAIGCALDNIDDAMLRTSLVAGFTGDEEAADAADQTIEAALARCDELASD